MNKVQVDFTNPINVKAFIKDFDHQIDMEEKFIKRLHITLPNLFSDLNEKRDKDEYEHVLKNHFKNEHKTLTALNVIYDCFAKRDAMFLSVDEIIEYIDEYLSEEKTYSYIVSISDKEPLVATIYPDTRDVKLELRRELEDYIERITFDKNGEVVD